MFESRAHAPALTHVGVVHAVRTSIAAAIALGLASLLGMPEAYWAPISTIIVMQSTLGASWTVSRNRLIGTLLGAFCGGLLGGRFHSNLAVFAAGILALGLVCMLLRLDQSAYRFAGVTFGIVLLVAPGESAWLVGFQRFVEVSLGIAVGLGVAAAWPHEIPGRRNG